MRPTRYSLPVLQLLAESDLKPESETQEEPQDEAQPEPAPPLPHSFRRPPPRVIRRLSKSQHNDPQSGQHA